MPYIRQALGLVASTGMTGEAVGQCCAFEGEKAVR